MPVRACAMLKVRSVEGSRVTGDALVQGLRGEVERPKRQGTAVLAQGQRGTGARARVVRQRPAGRPLGAYLCRHDTYLPEPGLPQREDVAGALLPRAT